MSELAFHAGLDEAVPPAPRVREWPIVGSVPGLMRDPVAFFLRCYRAHGPVYRIRLGTELFTVLAGPEGCGFVSRDGRGFLTAERVWSEPSRLMGCDPRANVVNVEGDRHAELRGMLRGGMSKSAAGASLGTSMPIVRAATERALVAELPVDAVAFARAVVFEQLGRTMAGRAPEEVYDAASRILQAIVRATRVPLLKRLPPPPSVRRAASVLRALGEEVRAAPPEARSTYLKDVLRGLDEGVYAAADLPLFMLTPFVAGLDTMAHTLAFVLYRLAFHPEWRARLRAEVEAAVAARGALDAQAVADCEELGYFVQEVMRIHPLSPAVIRFAERSFVLGGHQIREGDRLLVAHTTPHMMEEFYPEPERFDPMRFHPDRAEHRGTGRYAPYGIGAHICLGAGTADVLLRANAAAILLDADVVSADPRYVLRVSNASGARPVGFEMRLARQPRAEAAVARSA